MHALERKVLLEIGEDPDSPDVFTDTADGIAPVRDSLNDAIQELAMLEGSMKREYLLPLRKSQRLYRFNPTNGYMGWITDVWLVNKKRRLEQTGILKLSRYDPRWMITSADPRAYFPIGSDAICVYPKPSATSDMLQITIVEIPAEYADDNAKINLKKDFHYAAIHFAVSEYWASRGDAAEAQKHYDMYLDGAGLRKRFEQSPQKQSRFRTNKEPYPTETT